MRYSKRFKDKAVKKVIAFKDTKSITEIAKELNISKDTLYTWIKKAKEESTTDTPLSLSDKLQMLGEVYSMSEEEINAYCREKGIFKHQLKEWERDFLTKDGTKDESSIKVALQEEKKHSQALAKELRRKEKALAETAALLVLQKKFQALLEDEEL